MQLREMFRIIAVGGFILALLSPYAGPDTAAASTSTVTKQTIPVKSLQDGHVIEGSNAKLQRRSGSLKVKVKTRELHSGETVDVLWAVFNDPSACTEGNPVTGSPCGPNDLPNDATGATLQFAAGGTVDEDGEFKISASIAVGDTSGCLEGFPCREGVTNPLGAEVHVVIVQDGTVVQGAQFIP